MAYDGSGNYSLPPGSIVSDGTTIDAADHNTPVTDIAAALSQVLLRSGVAPMTGALNMGGFAITNTTGVPTSGGDNVFTGANAITTAASAGIPLELASTNPDAIVGPILSLYRNSTTPAATDVGGAIYFYGKDNLATKQLYGAITVAFSGIADTAEDGTIFLSTVTNGTVGTRMIIGAGVYHPSATGLDKGAGTLNFPTIYHNGTELGSAATKDTGTSGATVPLLNGLNTWSSVNSFSFNAGGATGNPAVRVIRPDAGAAAGYYFAQFITSGELGSIATAGPTGNVTAYNTTSDGRLKPAEFRRPLDDSGTIVDQLNPIHFRWRGSDIEDFGLVAQEVHAVLPGHVLVGDDDPRKRPGDEGFRPWQMQRGALEAILVAEIKALRARVAALEAASGQ